MTTNKKKLLITESMSHQGWSLFNERGDIETVQFSNLISARDFDTLRKSNAPVHGVALGATRFGEAELEAAQDMKVVARIGVGYDSVDFKTAATLGIPVCITPGTNENSVAEQAFSVRSHLTWFSRTPPRAGRATDRRTASEVIITS